MKFKYTGNWKTDFNNRHPLLPDLVIDIALENRINEDVPIEKQKESKSLLMKVFARVYKHNENFAQKILNGKGNKGRDMLYVFANHWLDGLVKNNFVPDKFFTS